MKKIKFLYHIPSVYTISAARTYLNGYKNAVLDLGHDFKILTADDDIVKIFDQYKPDIFMTSLNPYVLKYLDIDKIKKQKKLGMKVYVNIPFWKSPLSKLRINEAPSISENKEYVELIKSGNFGDIYYNVCEQDDPRMKGFKEATGYPYHTVLLAADKTVKEVPFSNEYACDIAFIGTYLPERRNFMKKHVFPLKKKYDLKLYCQDLTYIDRSLGFAMKVGQYFNIPYMRSFKKNNVTFQQEQSILKSSTICLNIHEDYQKRFGRDFNDRTFKIPLFGGFEITDNVKSIGKYLKDGKEIVIAKNTNEWFDKIDYYLKNPEKRIPIIKAGQTRVLNEHTYHNRVNQLISIMK